MTSSTGEPKYKVIPIDGGKRYDWQNDNIKVHLTSDDTNGAFTLVEDNLKPTFYLPLHVHHQHSETFHILEGNVEFTLDKEIFVASVGTTIHVPPGVPHAVRPMNNQSARMLMLYMPGGFDRLLVSLRELTSGQLEDMVLMRKLNEEFDNYELSTPAEASSP